MPEPDLQTRAIRLLQNDQPNEAAELLLAARAGGDPRIEGVLALALQCAGRWAESSESYRRAIAHATGQLAGLWFNLGSTLSAQRRLDDAASAYETALALAPDLHVARMNLGTVRHQQGRLAAAEQAFREVCEADPSDLRAKVNLGAVLCGQKRFAEAEAVLAEASIVDDPEAARALAGLAVVLTAQGRNAEAIAAAQSAVARDPELAEAHEQLAAAAFAAGEHEITIEAAVKACGLEESATTHELLGAGLASLGRLREAAESFERAIALSPRSTSPLRNLAAVRDNLGERDAAVAAYRRILELEPDDAGVLQSLGGVLSRKGERAEAIAIFERLHEANPDDVSIRYQLAALRGERPTAPPDGYVAGLFDQYAPRFDKHLVKDLGYIGHLVLAEVLGDERAARAVDLGCGTGLVGAAIRARCDHLTGVDLSEKMIEAARKKEVYDQLVRAELVAYLDDAGEPLDLVTASDVLMYVGDLGPLWSAIARRLAPGGRFAFNVEIADGADWRLEPWGRYSYAPAYLEALAAAHGLAVEHKDALVLRHEQTRPVDALVYVLRNGRSGTSRAAP